MDKFLAVLLAILPVIILIAAGLGLRRLRLMSPVGIAEMGKLVYWLALPCLLFSKLAVSDQGQIPWFGIGLSAACYTLTVALVLFSSRGQPAAKRGSLVSMAYRANGAFVGLPVAILLVENGVCDPSFAPFYLILLAATVPIFNILSVCGFLLPQHGIDRFALRKIGLGLLKNPLIWASMLGVAVAQLRWGHALADNVCMRSITLIGQAAIPLALIMAGASLRLHSLRSGGLHFWFWICWKMCALPSIIFALCLLFQVDQNTLIGLIILSACPNAVAAVPMAQELGGDEELTAAAVVVTTLLCPFSLVLFILLAQAA